VADIGTHCQQMNLLVPSGNTGDYCRARAKLSWTALRRLVAQTAQNIEQEADPSWLWHGLHAKLVDGFTFTMMDTPANQGAFPQAKTQAPGVGLPVAWACAILSLATAAIQDIAVGPYGGKETGETALLRSLLDDLHEGDLVVFDRYFCSYMMLALLQGRSVQACTRLHHCRPHDFRQAASPVGLYASVVHHNWCIL
jgi:putative transposase